MESTTDQQRAPVESGPASASASTSGRRALQEIRGLSHAAIRVRDIERTRQFYEDVLGLPLVYCRVDRVPRKGVDTDYIHAFFEMGSGYLAFFEFVGEPFGQAGDTFEAHLAARVDSMEALRDIEQRLCMAGWPCRTSSHSWCFSLYFIDPDQWPLEIAFHYPHADGRLDQSEAAHAALEEWVRAGRRMSSGPLNAPPVAPSPL